MSIEKFKFAALFLSSFIYLVSFATENPVPKTKYGYHLKAAKGFGIPAVKTNKQMTSLVKSKKLTPTVCKKGCTIKKLSYSKAYMVPKANKVLNEISKEFYKRTGGATFTITSLTRSMHDQHKLTKVNGNARKSESSHNYGASFDISYVRFNKKLGTNPRLEKTLNSVLTKFQNEGKLFFIREYSQKCYHVTVRG